jgi:hypothetical protein
MAEVAWMRRVNNTGNPGIGRVSTITGGSNVIQRVLDLKKIVIFDNIFGNLFFLNKFFVPLNCLIIFIEKKIFNILHNEIIIQKYQNIKLHKRKLS